MKKRSKILLITIILGIFLIPSLLLKLEPDARLGLVYYFLAESRYEEGDIENAKEFMKISLKKNPYSKLSQKLEQKINEAK